LIHLTIQQLSSHLDGELATSSEALVTQHLATCEACSSKLSKLKEQDSALIRALTGHPNESFSERLSGALEEKTRSYGPRAMAPRVEPSGSAGASAPVESAGRAQPTARASAPERKESPVRAEPDVRSAPAFRAEPAASRAPRWRTRLPGKKASFPWAATLFIAALIGSVGAVKSGIGLVTNWLESSAPTSRKPHVAAAEVPARGSLPPAPGATAPASGVTPPAPGMAATASPAGAVASPSGAAAPSAQKIPPREPAPSRDEADGPWRVDESVIDAERDLQSAVGRSVRVPDPQSDAAGASDLTASGGSTDSLGGSFAEIDANARSAVRIAQRLESQVMAEPSAEGYDAAAAEWERSLSLLRGDAYREACLRRAEARYRAWQFERTDERATSAGGAIRAYLVSAQSGPDRHKVTGWLSEVEHARFR